MSQDITSGQEKKRNNAVGLNISNFFPNGYAWSSAFPIRQVGIFYERTIKGRFKLGVSYNQWKFFSGPKPEYPGLYRKGKYLNPYVPIGTLDSRYKYKMVDLYSMYKISINKFISINSGLGIFYSTGYNSYVVFTYVSPTVARDAQIITEERLEHFFGIAPLLKLNAELFNERFEVGIHGRGRFFANQNYRQLDIGINVGVRF